VVTVIEYTKNQTDDLTLLEVVQFIIDNIDDNKYLFDDIYGVKNVRSGKPYLLHLYYTYSAENNLVGEETMPNKLVGFHKI